MNSTSSGVSSVSFSPDGTRIATGNDALKVAMVWDARTGKHLLDLKGHTDAVASVSFSPDGTRIATASSDGTARVWDVKTGTPLLDLKGHTGPVTSVCFSPDGARLVTGSYDTTARVWDARTGTPLLDIKSGWGGISSVSFSPDGTRIATANHSPFASVWDVTTGTPLLHLEGRGVVTSVSFSPDGTRIATGGADRANLGQAGEVMVSDARTGTPLLHLKGHAGPVLSVSFSPDGTRIVTGSGDHTAKVWDVTTGTPLLDLKGHFGGVTSVSFSPDGARIVTARDNATTDVWDAWTGTPLFDLGDDLSMVGSASFSPDGTRIVTANGVKTAKVWDAKTGKLLLDLKGHTGPVLSVSFSPDGTRILTGSGDHTAKVWDVKTGTPLLDLKGHTGGVTSVSFSPNGTRIVTGSEDRTARVWDARIDQEIKGGESPDAEERDYRLFHTRPSFLLHAEGYAAAQKAQDPFAARFHLDRILSLPEQRTTARFSERNAFPADPLVVARTGFHHPALAGAPYDRGAVALLAIHGNRLAQRLVAQQFLRDGKPGPAIPLLLWCLASRPAASPPVEEQLLAQAYSDQKQPDEARRFYRAAREWLDRPRDPRDTLGVGFAANGDPRRNPFDWEAWHECDVFRMPFRLTAVLRGEEQLTDNVERLTFARMAYDLKLFAGATWFWAEALASDPKLGDDLWAQHRYKAACAAALAAAGQGKDEPALDGKALANLRRQALDWLKSELTVWSKLLVSPSGHARTAIVRALSPWQQDIALAGVRDAAALAKLPVEEQKAWAQFWADLAELLKKARPPLARPQPALEHAARGDWKAAAAAYAQFFAVQPLNDGERGFEYAAVLLLAGDQAGYRKVCAEMLQRSGQPGIRPYHVARACTLAPDSVKDAALSGKKAENELGRYKKEFWSLTEQGALAYRAGRYDEAAALLEQSLEAERRPARAVMSWLWLSLVEQRRGKPAAARAWLEKATKWLAQYPGGYPVKEAESMGLHLHNWLEAQVLCREAEALLAPKK